MWTYLFYWINLPAYMYFYSLGNNTRKITNKKQLLLREIMDVYERRVEPEIEDGGPIRVTVGLELIRIIEVVSKY